LEKAKVIRPYVPLFGSSRVSALLHDIFRKKSVRRNSGLYKFGHGEKSVIWYWEFDVDKRYFHQFKTIDYAAAVDFYKANKFTVWDKVVEGDAEGNKQDNEGEGEGDSHEYEAETDVRGQDDGQNVRDDNGDSKDNDNLQDNEGEKRGNQDIVHSS